MHESPLVTVLETKVPKREIGGSKREGERKNERKRGKDGERETQTERHSLLWVGL